jgi:sugar fermentation stimulation protein A
MGTLARPGVAVRLSTPAAGRRRLAHTLELVRAGRTWVGVHPARANALAALALAAGVLPSLTGYTESRREATAPGGCRLDFRLTGRAGDPRPCWLEVKSVTLAAGDAARFPDCPTERGRRHVATLARLARGGARAVLLFVVQRGDCRRVEAAREIDPRFAAALRRASRDGVELLALRVIAAPHRLVVAGPLPVAL